MIKFFSKQMNNKKGFTLIELVVVVAILGILAAIVVPRIGRYRTQAANKAHNANVRSLMGAATTYLAEHGTDEEIDWPGEDSEDEWKEYINSWPTPPKGAEYTEDEVDVDVYTVTNTGDSGEITVKPGLIPEEDDTDGGDSSS